MILNDKNLQREIENAVGVIGGAAGISSLAFFLVPPSSHFSTVLVHHVNSINSKNENSKIQETINIGNLIESFGQQAEQTGYLIRSIAEHKGLMHKKVLNKTTSSFYIKSFLRIRISFKFRTQSFQT